MTNGASGKAAGPEWCAGPARPRCALGNRPASAGTSHLKGRATMEEFAASLLQSKPCLKSKPNDPEEYYPGTTVDEWLKRAGWAPAPANE